MDGIHPKFVLSKRFPVHAAIEQLDLHALKDLLTPVSDARFHFGRKLTNTDISVLHQACTNRAHSHHAILDIVKLCIALGAPVNDVDCIGQTPLFYAFTKRFTSNCQGEELVPLLLRGGASVNTQRQTDLWTPLFLAAMLGKLDTATLLLQAGADTSVRDTSDRTADLVAREFGYHSLADMILSPRNMYRPTFPAQFMEFLKSSSTEEACTILWDEHLDWRDEDSGATLLHIACWTGNVNLLRSFSNDMSGRKLFAVSTKAGLSPLMFAIINGQAGVVEEYLTNRISKNTIYWTSDVIKETKQTIPHLLLQFCPSVHPRILLKRKDLTAGIMNATDWEGNTPVLRCAMQDSRDTLRRLLSSKAAIERHLLDLSIQNMEGRNVVHYLVINRDKFNLRLVLNLLEDAGEALDAVDCHGMSPLKYCYSRNCVELARVITTHPKVRSAKKINLDIADPAGKTLMHLAAEEGNVEFWRVLADCDWCDLSLRDDEGNTPLMLATANKRRELLELWLEQGAKCSGYQGLKMMTARNSSGHNLFMLVLLHLDTDLIRSFIKLTDLTLCIDQCDNEGNNALLIAAMAEKWEILKIILEDEKIRELAIDVHPKTKDGHTALVLVLLAFVKLERKILSYQMKNDTQNLNKSKQDSDSLWELVKTLLDKERDIHGTNPVSSKEAGFISLKKQMESSSQIKSPLSDEVLSEFAKLYKVNVKQKKKPEVIPEPVKEEPKKVLPISSFQQKMNDIYKQGVEAEKKKNTQEEKKEEKKEVKKSVESPKLLEPKVERKTIESNIANNAANLESEKILNLVSVVEKKVANKKSEIVKPKKTDEKKNLMELEEAINEEILWAQEQKRLSKEEEGNDRNKNQVDTVTRKSSEITVTEDTVSPGEPSLEEIRSKWKKKKPRPEIKKEEFDVNSLFEDIAKKAEAKVSLGDKEVAPREEKVIRGSDNPDPSKDTKFDSTNIINLINLTEKKVEEKKKELLVKQVETVKEEEQVTRKESSTKTEKINSEKISKPVEKTEKTNEREDGKESRVRKEKENDLENAINEEVQWAYEQKRIMKEELEKTNGISEDKNVVDKKRMLDDVKRQKGEEEKEIVNILAKKAKEKLAKEKEEKKITEEKIAKEKEEMRKARQMEESKRSEEERKRKEKELEIAINEEILWANEQKKLSNDTQSTEQPSIDTPLETDKTSPMKSGENVTPPAPARRRRNGGTEEGETPVIPNRRSRVERPEWSPEVMEGRRSVAVGVEVRPGYAHASTQTDPVKTSHVGV